MIGRLSGRLDECRPGQALIDVAGVGYLVQIPLSTFYVLQPRTGSEVTVHIHTHVREEALQLFGFGTPEERHTFERLLAVSGVGPRMALAVLSGIGTEDLRRALAEGDRPKLERIPGVGRKTAERILLELRDRPPRRKRGAEDRTSASTPDTSGPTADAVSALRNLGYDSDAAERAVDAAMAEAGPADRPGSAPSLETLLRAALRALVR